MAAKSHLNRIRGATLDEKQETLELQLQMHVNILIDSSLRGPSANQPAPGAKQRLEKKKGLFRQNIMGKRVNFCARTVITPGDFYLELNFVLMQSKPVTRRLL